MYLDCILISFKSDREIKSIHHTKTKKPGQCSECMGRQITTAPVLLFEKQMCNQR